MKKKLICAIVPLFLYSSACTFSPEEKTQTEQAQHTKNQTQTKTPDDFELKGKYFNTIETAGSSQVITNPENILVLVNKDFTLPVDYKPADLVVPNVPFSFGDADVPQKYIRKEAAAALESLFSGAKKSGIELFAVSGFRSYDRQGNILNQEIAAKGEKKAEQAVALPGQSEHQTGLAMDISSRSVNLEITEKFGEVPEGKWIKKNAHKYGFIVRYENDKTEVTEFMYEPWHLRYVGKKTAAILNKHDLTLEEFFEQAKKI
ncbi:D-alanyl-D-alanine carboxypeptidase family protein [Bacillus mangrovi]|uniref:D-alanyl-D-alanine carboxypeptidase family protein n=1 Tax=Metabacillus mangrovi TaxID=1491830 RepID=A0A7X2S3A1_9BACI|nr:M15 family metallopeptidase [Metabacillus mangrovi]MTH52011.1 D-alanyl-D-alanine carboxypeptidase family protein [Metabacillus mangrovi]